MKGAGIKELPNEEVKNSSSKKKERDFFFPTYSELRCRWILCIMVYYQVWIVILDGCSFQIAIDAFD